MPAQTLPPGAHAPLLPRGRHPPSAPTPLRRGFFSPGTAACRQSGRASAPPGRTACPNAPRRKRRNRYRGVQRRLKWHRRPLRGGRPACIRFPGLDCSGGVLFCFMPRRSSARRSLRATNAIDIRQLSFMNEFEISVRVIDGENPEARRFVRRIHARLAYRVAEAASAKNARTRLIQKPFYVHEPEGTLDRSGLREVGKTA